MKDQQIRKWQTSYCRPAYIKDQGISDKCQKNILFYFSFSVNGSLETVRQNHLTQHMMILSWQWLFVLMINLMDLWVWFQVHNTWWSNGSKLLHHKNTDADYIDLQSRSLSKTKTKTARYLSYCLGVDLESNYHWGKCKCNLRAATIHGNYCAGWGDQTWERKIWKTSNFNKGGREHCQPCCIYHVAAFLNYSKWLAIKIGNWIF